MVITLTDLDFNSLVLSSDATMQNAIKKLEENIVKLVLVSNDNLELLGTITDGDIRRAILSGHGMNSNLNGFMNSSPISAKEGSTREAMLNLMKEKELLHLPIISKKNKLIGLETLSTLSGTKKYDNAVFLMAGGFGKRLTPLTNQMPKPLLEVGTKPILEEILLSFINSGFHNFYISTHFMADKIRDYFRDGSEWGVSIKYIHEEKPLGTAGALSLLPEEEIDLPLIMMNGDLISNINFSSLLDYHRENKAELTMCISEYALKIPYGVIVKEDDRLIKIDEKPSHKFFINAGIYVINSDILKTVRKDTPIDMPALIEGIISDKESVKVYPIHEYWLDIGQLDDFNKAKLDKKNK